MYKIVSTLSIFALLFIFACGGSEKENEQDIAKLKEEIKEEVKKEMEAKESETSENTESTEASETPADAKTVKAKFDMRIANTAGEHYLFIDESGTELDLFPADNVKGMDFVKSLRPNTNDNDYNGKWFEITYRERMEQYKGSGPKMKKLYLLEAKPASGKSASTTTGGISPSKLKNISFGGVEPYWSLVLKEDYAEYTPMGENTKKMYYKKSYGDRSKPKLSDALVKKSGTHAEIQAELDGHPINLSIRKEKCSDGMSDNEYSFSIVMMFAEAGAQQGCGRIK